MIEGEGIYEKGRVFSGGVVILWRGSLREMVELCLIGSSASASSCLSGLVLQQEKGGLLRATDVSLFAG